MKTPSIATRTCTMLLAAAPLFACETKQAPVENANQPTTADAKQATVAFSWLRMIYPVLAFVKGWRPIIRAIPIYFSGPSGSIEAIGHNQFCLSESKRLARALVDVRPSIPGDGFCTLGLNQAL